MTIKIRQSPTAKLCVVEARWFYTTSTKEEKPVRTSAGKAIITQTRYQIQ